MAVPVDSRIMAQYPKQNVVRSRNYVGLNNWAAYQSALPIPTAKPDVAFVKNQITAGKIPQQTNEFVNLTISYYMQDPATQANITKYLNEFNDEATETALFSEVEAVTNAFMPRFTDAYVTMPEVDRWYNDHGFSEPPPETPVSQNALPRATGNRPLAQPMR
jgi:hypothetical protein